MRCAAHELSHLFRHPQQSDSLEVCILLDRFDTEVTVTCLLRSTTPRFIQIPGFLPFMSTRYFTITPWQACGLHRIRPRNGREWRLHPWTPLATSSLATFAPCESLWMTRMAQSPWTSIGLPLVPLRLPRYGPLIASSAHWTHSGALASCL